MDSPGKGGSMFFWSYSTAIKKFTRNPDVKRLNVDLTHYGSDGFWIQILDLADCESAGSGGSDELWSDELWTCKFWMCKL